MPAHTRSMCACSSNSPSSSSSMSLTTSLTRIFWCRSSSASSRIDSIATDEFRTTCRTRRRPSSICLEISTSPSRVSSATAPILRRYRRTGSTPDDALSAASSASASSSSASSLSLAATGASSPSASASSCSSSSSALAVAAQLALRRGVDDLDACLGQQREPRVHLGRRRDAGRHEVVDLVVGQEALGLALGEELVLLALAVLVGLVDRAGMVTAGVAAGLSAVLDARGGAPTGARARRARAQSIHWAWRGG